MNDIQLRGPNGIRQRMAEIQAKLDAAFPPKLETESVGQPGMPGSFAGSLQGQIGAGNVPVNPMSGAFSVAPSGAADQFRPLIQDAASEAGVDPALFEALVAVESSFDPNARSRAGAMGLSQLMPGTARELGVSNPFDPMQNLRGGATYLSRMLQRFGGDVKMALAAYNAGPGAVEKFGGIPPYSETQKYVDRVSALYMQRRNP